MTVSNTASSTKVYGNGAQTVFNYGFEIPTGAGYALYLEDSTGSVTLLAPSAYTISGIGSATGGTFTYPLSGSPLAAGNTLTLVRATPNQQQTSLGNQGAYYPQVVEAALDWLEMQIQELKNTAGLAIQAPAVDGSVPALPSAPLRANGYLGFDSSGNPMVAAGVTQGTVNVSTAMVPVVEAATVPDAAALLGLSAAMTPVTDAASINAGVAELGLAVILADMAALVAATSTTLPGSYAYIAGYYSAGDGGAGLFRYVASDTTSADNSGTIVVDASGRRWYRVWDGRSTSIREWGAKVDGSTDDSTSIQAAINFLQSGSENMGGAGGVVIFPTGTVLINAGITVSTGGITLQGAGWEEYLGYQGQYTPGEPGTHGTTVLTTSTSASPITLASDAANNAAVRDMMFRQTQPADASGWTPTIYPPTINVTGNSTQPGGAKQLENLFCWNCYEFIRIGSVGNPASRVNMRRIWGMPLQYGINGIFSSDIDRFNDIHFWQFDQNVPNIISWIQLNGVAMQATRLDGFMLHQFFAYGYAVGLALTSSTDGASQNFAISDFGADSCWWGILVNGTSGLNSGRITNAYHQSATGSTNPGGGGGYINSGTGPSNLDFANAYTNLALTSGVDVGTSDWSFANLRVTNYNQKSGGTYKGVNADTGGSVTLSGRVDITGGGSGPPTGGTGTVINWSGTATTNATASRALNSTYTNSTGKAMTVSVTFVAGASGVGNLIGLVAGNGVAITSVANNTYGNVTFVVPDGDTYEVTFSGTGTLNTWQETH